MQVTDFQWFDPNPEAVHGNPSKAIDCVVRAFCAALDRGWAEVYDELCYLGKQNHDMPNSWPVIEAMLDCCGFHKDESFAKAFPGKHKKSTIRDVAKMTKLGSSLSGKIAIIHAAHHLCCCRDGFLFDACHYFLNNCAYAVYVKG